MRTWLQPALSAGTRTHERKSLWPLLSGLPPRDQLPHPVTAAVQAAGLPEQDKSLPAVCRFNQGRK